MELATIFLLSAVNRYLEDGAPIERTSNLWYLVNDQKKASCNGLAAENVDKSYIFNAFISKHLSPFYMATPAMVLLPGKKVNGQWKAISATDRALMNTSTAYIFNQIEEPEYSNG